MKIVNIEESNTKLAITEQRALTGDCLRTGGPNWCHIGLLDNKQSTIIFNKYMLSYWESSPTIQILSLLNNWCHIDLLDGRNDCDQVALNNVNLVLILTAVLIVD